MCRYSSADISDWLYNHTPLCIDEHVAQHDYSSIVQFDKNKVFLFTTLHMKRFFLYYRLQPAYMGPISQTHAIIVVYQAQLQVFRSFLKHAPILMKPCNKPNNLLSSFLLEFIAASTKTIHITYMFFKCNIRSIDLTKLVKSDAFNITFVLSKGIIRALPGIFVGLAVSDTCMSCAVLLSARFYIIRYFIMFASCMLC